MPDHRRLILLSVIMLAAWFFLEDFVVFAFLPELIPDTPINLRGLWIILGLFLLFIFLFKKITRKHPELSVAYLTILGMLIGVFSEIIFQFYRQFTYTDMEPAERMMLFFRGVLGIGSLSAIMAFSIAVDIQFNKPWLSWLISVGLLLAMRYVAVYLGVL